MNLDVITPASVALTSTSPIRAWDGETEQSQAKPRQISALLSIAYVEIEKSKATGSIRF